MKKIVAFIFLISSFTYAQHAVKGIMSPALESDWVILYKIEGARQVFVQNTKITIDTIGSGNEKQVVGNFQFTLPKETKVGAYRVTYRLKGAGFVDFIYNKENISFVFNPEYPDQTVVFAESKENILYKEYLNSISNAQQKLDSIQIAVLRDSTLNMNSSYKKSYMNINAIQKHYLDKSKEMYVNPFIKASLRKNSPTIIKSSQKYLNNMIDTFFDNMDFSDTTILNSSFLVDRITDYVFYLNYSDDKETQEKLHKVSVDRVLSKISDPIFKKDVIEFLVTQFEASKNLALIDYLFNNYYNKLPKTLQNTKFKEEKIALLAAEVGRIAPDFSWKKNGKTIQLSKLSDAKNYLLIFWSTSCSHCLREIPQLYDFMKNNTNTKVIAFAMEKEEFVWDNYKKNLLGWHNVLGLGKWENKTARTYQVFSTPSYFILDENKKIIAKPEELKDVKTFIEKL